MSTLRKDAHIIKDIKASMLSMVWRESLNTFETNKREIIHQSKRDWNLCPPLLSVEKLSGRPKSRVDRWNSQMLSRNSTNNNFNSKYAIMKNKCYQYYKFPSHFVHLIIHWLYSFINSSDFS